MVVSGQVSKHISGPALIVTGSSIDSIRPYQKILTSSFSLNFIKSCLTLTRTSPRSFGWLSYLTRAIIYANGNLQFMHRVGNCVVDLVNIHTSFMFSHLHFHLMRHCAGVSHRVGQVSDTSGNECPSRRVRRRGVTVTICNLQISSSRLMGVFYQYVLFLKPYAVVMEMAKST